MPTKRSDSVERKVVGKMNRSHPWKRRCWKELSLFLTASVSKTLLLSSLLDTDLSKKPQSELVKTNEF